MVFSARLALEAVSRNPLRAGLTSLGILFGVASVIAMLAVGRGAEQEILAQMRLLGTNNVMITPIVEQSESSDEEEGAGEEQAMPSPTRYSPGLTIHDARSLVAIIPQVRTAVGEIVVATAFSREGRRRTGNLVGAGPGYFELVNLPLSSGSGFVPHHHETGAPVAVIGYGIKTRLFPAEDPIGKQIKAGEIWLTVVGVVGNQNLSEQVTEKLGIRDPGMDIYVPLTTALLRVRNRAKIAAGNIPRRRYRRGGDDEETIEERYERLNYHQLDRIIVQVREARHVPAVADVARRMLVRRHNQVTDFEITVPELLLRQEQRARTIFNVVLGSIASISLIVGGIGIMNIMLATVLERIREIGVRRAVGARRFDILSQFLGEAILISLAGGIAGILLGVGFSLGIERFAEIPTSVSAVAVALAFGVSITVGLGFGIVPAWRAAQQDPVVCLRHE